MRKLLFVMLIAVGAVGITACSGSDSNGGDNAPQAKESQGSTSLSVDTDDNSFSYKKDQGGDNTSVDVNSGDKNNK